MNENLVSEVKAFNKETDKQNQVMA